MQDIIILVEYEQMIQGFYVGEGEIMANSEMEVMQRIIH